MAFFCGLRLCTLKDTVSIVPFIASELHKTVTASSEEFLPEGPLVFVHPLSADLGTSNASLDLHVGKLWRTHKGKDVSLDIDANGYISIRSKALVSIETLETVKLPNAKFGYILPKVNLLGKGLTNAATKVDPGYNGRLIINLSNLSPGTIKLKYGQAFCALVIHRVDPPAKSYDLGPKSWPGVDQPRGWTQRIRDWADRNAGLLGLTGPFAAVLLYVLGIVIHKMVLGTWLSR